MSWQQISTNFPPSHGQWPTFFVEITDNPITARSFCPLAHSDLSYKNVLVDPAKGMACVINIDGLVVPGKYPPDVSRHPDFIAPEVVMISHLGKDDPNRKLPRRETDLHALSVLNYMYLLYRHPLRGGKLPVLNLYSSRKEGQFRPDNHRLMVWTGQSLFLWYANNLIAPNERLTNDQKKRVGYFVLPNGTWWLVNEGLPDFDRCFDENADSS